MKKFITLLVLAFTLGMNAQEDIERYKLYPTTNMWTFLELDTATGLMWQIQYDVEGDKRFKSVLNDFEIADGNIIKPIIGRFKLYPTQNTYNFILLDVVNGTVVQVQWGFDDDIIRGIVDIID
tara:strand:+ start:226 stop:594 length:369 start_codon:yes stop_codon:yes gene_type:complete